MALFPSSANADLETVKKLTIIAGHKTQKELWSRKALMENHLELTSCPNIAGISRVILPPCSVISLDYKWMITEYCKLRD